MSSGTQRRRGRQVHLYLNSEQYMRLERAAVEHQTSPGLFVKDAVVDALAAEEVSGATDWDNEVVAATDKLFATKLREQADRMVVQAPPPSLTEPPPPGFRCTFEDSGYRCALETGHGGIHISAQGYRLAAKRA